MYLILAKDLEGARLLAELDPLKVHLGQDLVVVHGVGVRNEEHYEQEEERHKGLQERNGGVLMRLRAGSGGWESKRPLPSL